MCVCVCVSKPIFKALGAYLFYFLAIGFLFATLFSGVII